MPAKLRSAIRNVRHNLELYATCVVCGFLLILKILHLVEDHWVDSGILVTLMLLAVGCLKDRAGEKALRETLHTIASKTNDNGALKWYTRRSDATPDMLADLDRFRHVVFMGISHRELADTLSERLQHTSKPLPWVSIEVYFAARLLGEAYEGRHFHSHLVAARQDVAALLTDPAYAEQLPHLRSLTFFQQTSFTTHTGSIFGDSPSKLDVIYAVHSAVHLHGDTHQGLTIRLVASRGVGFRDGRFDHYEAAYRALSQSSVRMGVFARSLWDSSALRWSDYARNSRVLAHSAAIAAKMITPKNGDSLLDIGSASGDGASVILEHHPRMSVVMLDGSPQMIRLLRDRFHKEPRVRIALCQLPALDGDSVDLDQDDFAFIVIHQCLGDLLNAFGSIGEVAIWCRDRLRQDGQLLITAHNTLVATDPPSGFADWEDPFRAQLVKKLRKANYKTHPVDAKPMIAENEVTNAFVNQGFKLRESCHKVIKLNYEERRRLWHVPAVMNSMIRGGQPETATVQSLVDDVANSLQRETTMPRTVVFWLFALGDGAS